MTDPSLSSVSPSRLDSFPYRHRVAEVMTHPILTAPPYLTLGQACDRMHEARVSALVAIDLQRRPVGIVTERDLVGALSRHRGAALEFKIADVMSSPVAAVPSDAFVYTAIGRMTRLGIRHLVVTDGSGAAVGMVTGRALLRLRSQQAMVLGDSISQAFSAVDLAAVRQALPDLARRLLDEEVDVIGVAAVISSVLRDMTARAAEMAVETMSAEGWGEAPAPWCLLILGSGGRGESLLGSDQDNAIVHDGQSVHDGWFAELGKRLNATLHAAGIPLCKGDVMARNPAWRRSLDGWKAEIGRWIALPENQTVLNVDIFYDFVGIYGERRLAEDLRAHALAAAADSPFFLQLLAHEIAQAGEPLGFFGQFLTGEGGRVSIKQFGTMPIVAAARVLAAKHRIGATATGDRIAGLVRAGIVTEIDAEELMANLRLFMEVVLRQQLLDLERGDEPSGRIDPGYLPRVHQRRLKAALKNLRVVKALVGNAMSRR